MRLAWLFLVAAACTEHGSGGGVPGGGSGKPCGGFGGGACAPNEFCDFGRNSCGATDEQGTCRARPTGCPDIFQPVCGCDGTTHGSECDAQSSGVDVDAMHRCPVEPGQFACGFTECRVNDQVCRRSTSDVGTDPDGFACGTKPSGCTDCACLAGEPCGSLCTGSAATGFTLTCPGG